MIIFLKYIIDIVRYSNNVKEMIMQFFFFFQLQNVRLFGFMKCVSENLRFKLLLNEKEKVKI